MSNTHILSFSRECQSNLDSRHLEDLKRSGLSEETIKEAGIYSVRPQDIPRKLGWNPKGVASLLAFPYPGMDGFERYKPFYKDGYPDKPKYLQPKDTPPHLYIPHRSRGLLKDTSTPLYITEGEKKTLKAIQEGLPCIGIGGLWNWKKEGEEELIPDFDLIELKERKVIIIPDNDWKNGGGYRKNLVQAVTRLGQKLRERGAIVTIKELPQGPLKGLDDYLCHHSIDKFMALKEIPLDDLLSQPLPSFEEEKDQWPTIREEAFYGIAGRFVKTVEPHTEAHPVGLLLQFLAGAGCLLGRHGFYRVEADRHYPNLYLLLVGETSKGRKGSSWGWVKKILYEVDSCLKTEEGLSSGEGLIWHVRDPIIKKTKEGEEVEDEGIKDKRLCIVESEFASVLKVLSREGNTLSPIIRRAWDSGDLATLTKHSKTKATGAHLSIVGHITMEELKRHLQETEMANGFANRFLFALVKRSKCLPFGGGKPDMGPIIEGLKETLRWIREREEFRVEMDEEAKKIWKEVYPVLSEGKPGLVGALINRAEAQVVRLATLFALLDRSDTIRAEHLLASLAIWDYVEASVRYIWRDTTGDRIANTILRALKERPEGMTQTEIYKFFKHHVPSEKITDTLSSLERMGKIKKKKTETKGRPITRWYRR